MDEEKNEDAKRLEQNLIDEIYFEETCSHFINLVDRYYRAKIKDKKYFRERIIYYMKNKNFLNERIDYVLKKSNSSTQPSRIADATDVLSNDDIRLSEYLSSDHFKKILHEKSSDEIFALTKSAMMQTSDDAIEAIIPILVLSDDSSVKKKAIHAIIDVMSLAKDN